MTEQPTPTHGEEDNCTHARFRIKRESVTYEVKYSFIEGTCRVSGCGKSKDFNLDPKFTFNDASTETASEAIDEFEAWLEDVA